MRTFTAMLVALAFGGCVDPDLKNARDALGQGRYAEAIQWFEVARSRLPPEEVAAADLASAHRALAMQHLDAGRCDEALAHFQSAEAHSPPLLADHRAVYECEIARDAPPEQRIRDLDRLVALGERRADTLRTLYRLEMSLGREDDALARLPLMEEKLALTLDDRKELAIILLRRERPQEAAAHVERVVKADPYDPIARLQLAEIREAQGDLDAARTLYHKLSNEFRRNPVVHLRLAAFLRRQGDEAGAAEAQATADRLRGLPPPPPPRDLRPLPKSRR